MSGQADGYRGAYGADYEDAPLVGGESLLALPGFWAAYLLWLTEGEGEGADEDPDSELEPDPAWFGADEADMGAAYEALSDPERWPVFRIAFGGGHSVVVLGRNMPEDQGTEYVVTHPAWDRTGQLATIDGHQAGPGLAWRELVHIARTPDSDPESGPGPESDSETGPDPETGPESGGSGTLRGSDVRDADARLLLLLPVLGEEDLPAEAFGMVADALVRVGAPVAGVRRLARLLLTDHPLWEPVTWAPAEASPLSGGGEPYPGILHCDGEWSPRSGVRLAAGITRERNDELARALGTWDGSSPSEP